MNNPAMTNPCERAAAHARAQACGLAEKLAGLVNDGADIYKLCKPLEELQVWQQVADALDDAKMETDK